jgi:2',3'-cyclic-nucleotide 2'-phosphodiesterase
MTIRILFLGDVVGVPGCAMLQKHLPKLKAEYKPDAIIVNGENSAADGRGITTKVMHFFKHCGVNLVTTGNHVFAKRDIYQYLQENKDLIRPLNFPSACPGVGASLIEIAGLTIGVMNVQGRVFMRELLSCPFKAAETALLYLKSKTPIILVDMHAETSSEKHGMGYFLDGRVSAVVGTHTHVQTADERILPGGTAYITDVGMGGALNSMIGMKKEPIIQQMITQLPTKFEVDTEAPFQLCGVLIDVDKETGKAQKISRIRVIDNELRVSEID